MDPRAAATLHRRKLARIRVVPAADALHRGVYRRRAARADRTMDLADPDRPRAGARLLPPARFRLARERGAGGGRCAHRGSRAPKRPCPPPRAGGLCVEPATTTATAWFCRRPGIHLTRLTARQA